MATIDIAKIVGDKLSEMDSSGLIQAKIEENIEKSVTAAIDDALGGYGFRRLISDELKKQLPDIVQRIGLDGYNSFLAETLKETVVTKMKSDAKKAITESVSDVFCRKFDSYRLSDIIKEWKAYIDPENEDERVDRNENHDGYTLRIDQHKSISGVFQETRVFLDEVGDHELSERKDAFEFVVELRQFANRSILGAGATIEHVYVYGIDMVNAIRDVTGHFRGLLANLYINKTPIMMDLDEIDVDDHYYETGER